MLLSFTKCRQCSHNDICKHFTEIESLANRLNDEHHNYSGGVVLEVNCIHYEAKAIQKSVPSGIPVELEGIKAIIV